MSKPMVTNRLCTSAGSQLTMGATNKAALICGHLAMIRAAKRKARSGSRLCNRGFSANNSRPSPSMKVKFKVSNWATCTGGARSLTSKRKTTSFKRKNKKACFLADQERRNPDTTSLRPSLENGLTRLDRFGEEVAALTVVDLNHPDVRVNSRCSFDVGV